MSESVDWQIDAQCLLLSGELTANTLLPLWSQRASVLASINMIDVTSLRHVDSAGLACIVGLIGEAHRTGVTLKVKGVTEKLSTLIAIYNLKEVISANILP